MLEILIDCKCNKIMAWCSSFPWLIKCCLHIVPYCFYLKNKHLLLLTSMIFNFMKITAYSSSLVFVVNLCSAKTSGSTYPFLLAQGSSCLHFFVFIRYQPSRDYFYLFLNSASEICTFEFFDEVMLHGDICCIFFWNNWRTCIL